MTFNNVSDLLFTQLHINRKFLEQQSENFHMTSTQIRKQHEDNSRVQLFTWVRVLNYLNLEFFIRFDNFDYEIKVRYDKKIREFVFEKVRRKNVENGIYKDSYTISEREFQKLIADLDVLNYFDVEFFSSDKTVKMKKRTIKDEPQDEIVS